MRGPDHGNSEKLRRSITHDLKASDLRKRPTEVTEFIETEAAKGYRPPAIKNVAEQHFGGKQIGVEFLQLESVRHAQSKTREGLNAPFIGADNLEEDIKESVEWLKSKDYSKSPNIEVLHLPQPTT